MVLCREHNRKNMKSAGLPKIILILLLVLFIGTVGYLSFVKKSFQITQQSIINSSKDSFATIMITPIATINTVLRPSSSSLKFSTEPIAECVECENGRTWNNKPCCTDGFETDCTSENGIMRWSDLHPVSTVLRGCFRKAPDAGQDCASFADCLSGVCDLESAVKYNKCSLLKKEITGGKNQYSGQEFYIATYSCGTNSPGVCTETIENRTNPGGVIHTFIMENKTLIETLQSGPIN